MANRNPKSEIRNPKSAFTLLEVVLAIALSATLLALIASAISMFLNRVDGGRQRVEQAQLARNLLRLVAADLRNVAVYAPQDTAIAQQLAAAAGSFDVDLISGGGSGSGSGGGTGGGGGTGTGGGSGDSGSSGSSSGASSSSSSTSTQYQQPLGVYGNLHELQIDVLQPARPMPAPPDSNALTQGDLSGPLWRGGIRTIRYYYRDGQRPTGDAIVTERFTTTGRTPFGGLVREESDRQQYDFAVQQGTANSFNELGQVLAPEVVGVQFRYSDGAQIYDEWNSETQQALPVAIEVRMWLENPTEQSPRNTAGTTANLSEATQYVTTIPIWRAALAASGGSSSGSSSSSSSSGGSSGSGSGDTGSPFGGSSSF